MIIFTYERSIRAKVVTTTKISSEWKMVKIVLFNRSDGGQDNLIRDFYVQQAGYGHQLHVETIPM
jgi:hypothetical protein